jgi:hypothetical protein
VEDSGLDSHDGKSDFFMRQDRHVNSFCFFRMILVRPVSEETAGKSFSPFELTDSLVDLTDGTDICARRVRAAI